MEQLLQKNFKDLSDMTLLVADRFFIARRIHAMEKEDHLAEFDCPDLESYTQYIDKVSKAFTKLTDSERNLINNEFFFQSYHNWWESIYSKATFYRYKKKAMMKFLEAFYDE
jgi:hypothetical protein